MGTQNQPVGEVYAAGFVIVAVREAYQWRGLYYAPPHSLGHYAMMNRVCLSVRPSIRLGQTDRQTDDGRQCFMPTLRGRGIKTKTGMAPGRTHTFTNARQTPLIQTHNRVTIISQIVIYIDVDMSPPQPSRNPNSALNLTLRDPDYQRNLIVFRCIHVPSFYRICKNRLSSFCIVLLTNKPTNASENITSLSEVEQPRNVRKFSKMHNVALSVPYIGWNTAASWLACRWCRRRPLDVAVPLRHGFDVTSRFAASLIDFESRVAARAVPAPY